VRDAASADADLRAVLGRFRPPAGTAPAGALLFTCAGRGQALFGEPDHDADLVRKSLGEVPVGGFFCAGEFGPLGRRSFVHTFSASALVVLHQDTEDS
jgi:small ligand-binding sensory domain FIST